MKNERHQHELFSAYLRKSNIHFIHARMDKESTIAEGWPDFTLIHQGWALCIEFKFGKGQCSAAQLKTLNSLNMSGTPAHVCRDVIDAIRITAKWIEGENIKPAEQAKPIDSSLKVWDWNGKMMVVKQAKNNGITCVRAANAQDIATLDRHIF